MSKAKVLGYAGVGSMVLGGLLCATVFFGSWYRVNDRERGIVLRNGAISSVSQPGLNFKLPYFDSVAYIPIDQHIEVFEDMSAFSSDRQEARLRVSVNYQVEADAVAQVYHDYYDLDGVVQKVVRPFTPQQVKIVFGHFTANTMIHDRDPLNRQALAALVEATKGLPLKIKSVQVEDIRFSAEYMKAVEDSVRAEVEVGKLKQNFEREKVQAQITTTKAQAEADATLAQAKANADAVKLRGEADAAAIEARGKALSSNPKIVDLIQAERWNGALPTTMVPGSALPMVKIP